jgi:hypothetical protein
VVDRGHIALLHTSHLNAWSAGEAVRALGMSVRTTDAQPVFPIPVIGTSEAPLVERLLFTEERSLRKFLDGPVGKATGYPSEFPSELLDDKAATGLWLSAHGEVPIPFSVDPRADMYPKFLKCRHSWVDANSRPRGWICRNPRDEAMALARIKSNGWHESAYFSQMWLGDDAATVRSVCGFFDATRPERNLLLTTEKVLGYSAEASSSAVVATVADPGGLVERTSSILNQLEFTGPFELEFLEHQGNHYVIELNPRLWLQHGIFTPYGNGLMKRCLDMDSEADWSQRLVPHEALWVDSHWLLMRFLSLDLEKIGTLKSWVRRGYTSHLIPSVDVLLSQLLPRLATRKMARAMKLIERRLT